MAHVIVRNLTNPVDQANSGFICKVFMTKINNKTKKRKSIFLHLWLDKLDIIKLDILKTIALLESLHSI